MVGPDILHVAVSPPGSLEGEVVRKAQAILGKDPYETRLLLTGAIPKIVAHPGTAREAESVAGGLRELGLPAIVLNDSEIRKHSSRFIARTIVFGEREVIFRDCSGVETRLGANEVSLILEGLVRTQRESETAQTKMKFSLGATMLTAGIPIWRSVTEKGKEVSLQSEHFVRLYDRLSSEPRVEILQRRTNYAFLGAAMASNSPANFRSALARLREAFPQAVFDDRLFRVRGAGGPAAGGGQELETNCKLIYLFHRVGG